MVLELRLAWGHGGYVVAWWLHVVVTWSSSSAWHEGHGGMVVTWWLRGGDAVVTRGGYKEVVPAR